MLRICLLLVSWTVEEELLGSIEEDVGSNFDFIDSILLEQ